MKLEFSKMHGIGNDYVYLNCIERVVNKVDKKNRKLNKKETDMKKIDFYYEQFISWADEFDNASQERKKMIICTLFKEITVGKGYKIEILMDSSYEQFLR